MIPNDLSFYIGIALAEHQTVYATALEAYGDKNVAWCVAAEVAYIELHNALPDWGIYIESFERIDGNYLFIHRDRGEMVQ